MSEAQLEIKPTVVGDVRRQLSPINRELQRFERSQRRAMTQAERNARRLERAYDSIGMGLGRASRGLGTFTRGLFSLQSLAVGAATGFAGRTAVDLLIGSNERLESQRLTFRTLIGDTEKANQLIQNLRQEAATTPFEEADILEAGKRLLRSTRDNIQLNRELVRQAETLAALNPERTVTDAAEAILDAQLGEFERLKEFSIKLSKGEIDNMKKSGETLGDTAIRAINERISDLGAENLVEELGRSIRGKRSTLIDSFRRTFQEVGEQAFEEVGRGIDGLQMQLDELTTDPQFREDMREVSKLVADAAKFAFQLARDLPGAIRSIRDFVRENRTALELGAGLFAANRLTGGGLGRGAFALGRRALFGRGGAGAAVGAAGALGEAQPVFVVNFPPGLGGMEGDFFQRRLTGMGAAGAGGGGALSAAERGALRFGPGGLVGQIGVGGVLGGGAILGAFALAGKALVDATEGTAAALKAQEDRLRMEAERRAGGGPGFVGRAQRSRQEALNNLERERRARSTGGVRDILERGAVEQLGGQTELDALGTAAAAKAAIQGSLRGKKGAELRQAVTDLNTELAGFGIEVTPRGRLRTARAVTGRLKELTEFDKQLQENPQAAQQLFEEGKLDEVIAEAEGLKRTRERGAALIERLSKVDVSKIEIPVTVVMPPGGDPQNVVRTVMDQRTAIEKHLTDLTIAEDQNRGG